MKFNSKTVTDNPVQRNFMDEIWVNLVEGYDDGFDVANYIAALRKMADVLEKKYEKEFNQSVGPTEPQFKELLKDAMKQ